MTPTEGSGHDPQTLREKVEAEVERLRARAQEPISAATLLSVRTMANNFADRLQALLDEPAQDEPRADQLLSKLAAQIEDRLTDNAGGVAIKRDGKDTAGILSDAAWEIRAYLSGEAEGG